MKESQPNHDLLSSCRTLSAYLLGTLEFETLFALQRRLIYDIGGDRTSAAVILCDHPPCITIGREGSRAHIRPNYDALNERFRPYLQHGCHHRRSPVRWVGRGGGAMLHLPGQVACYPIIPLDLLGLPPARYLEELQSITIELLKTFHIIGTSDPNRPGVRVSGRRVAHVGVAIRERITSFGLIINVEPKLELFHEVMCDGDPAPMTSLQRESSTLVRVQAVRQRLLEQIPAHLGFDRVSIFHNYPSTMNRSKLHAFAHRS